MLGFNADLQSQTGHLAEILKLNGTLYSVIEKAAGIGLQNYCIGAGCVTQTVWNYQMGFELTHRRNLYAKSQQMEFKMVCAHNNPVVK